jgi:hypothetical protein
MLKKQATNKTDEIARLKEIMKGTEEAIEREAKLRAMQEKKTLVEAKAIVASTANQLRAWMNESVADSAEVMLERMNALAEQVQADKSASTKERADMKTVLDDVVKAVAQGKKDRQAVAAEMTSLSNATKSQLESLSKVVKGMEGKVSSKAFKESIKETAKETALELVQQEIRRGKVESEKLIAVLQSQVDSLKKQALKDRAMQADMHQEAAKTREQLRSLGKEIKESASASGEEVAGLKDVIGNLKTALAKQRKRTDSSAEQANSMLKQIQTLKETVESQEATIINESYVTEVTQVYGASEEEVAELKEEQRQAAETIAQLKAALKEVTNTLHEVEEGDMADDVDSELVEDEVAEVSE